MAFDPITHCGESDWADAVTLALIWALPTILLALRSCSNVRASLPQAAAMAGAIGLSMALWLIHVRAVEEIGVMAMLLGVLSAVSSTLGVQVYRRCLARSGGGHLPASTCEKIGE